LTIEGSREGKPQGDLVTNNVEIRIELEEAFQWGLKRYALRRIPLKFTNEIIHNMQGAARAQFSFEGRKPLGITVSFASRRELWMAGYPTLNPNIDFEDEVFLSFFEELYHYFQYAQAEIAYAEGVRERKTGRMNHPEKRGEYALALQKLLDMTSAQRSYGYFSDIGEREAKEHAIQDYEEWKKHRTLTDR
jgi:hypothetical protein